MKEYTLIAKVTISTYTKVIAKSEEEAKQVADDRHFMDIPRVSEEEEYESWMIDEIDGIPFEIEIE